MQTLYERMISAELVNEEIREKVESLDEFVQSLDGVRGFAQPVIVVPKVDPLDLQKRIFWEYEKNPVLMDAIDGARSIEETLASYAIRTDHLLPRRVDPAGNLEVGHLSQLVSPVERFKTRGILSPDNLLSMYGYLGVMSTVAITLASWGQGIKMIVASNLAGNIISFLASYLGTSLMRTGVVPFYQAKYIDSKINEIYGWRSCKCCDEPPVLVIND